MTGGTSVTLCSITDRSTVGMTKSDSNIEVEDCPGLTGVKERSAGTIDGNRKEFIHLDRRDLPQRRRLRRRAAGCLPRAGAVRAILLRGRDGSEFGEKSAAHRLELMVRLHV